jgi:DNA polymerase-3 subunit delta'
MPPALLGHDEVFAQFRRRLQAGRLASTYLFVGPEGVGKRTAARLLAAALLCTENPPELLEACGHCESCRLGAAGSHPDLSEVALPEGKKTLPIEAFVGDREHRNQAGLCHEIALRPLRGRRRVAIVDDADWLSVESANCLLKTLEEPPPGAVIILIGTSRHRQLPTILSRAQIVRFERLGDDDLAQLLLDQAVAVDRPQALELARAAGGSLAAARELADSQLLRLRDRLAEQLLAEHVDFVRLSGEVSDYLGDAGTDAQVRRDRLRRLAGQATEAFRRQLRAACREQRHVERILAALDRCLEVETQLDRNANQNLMVEAWIADLAAMARGH